MGGAQGSFEPSELLRALELAADEFYVFDAEGRVLEANGCACEQLGYGRGELLGRGIADLSTRQTPETFARIFETLREEGPQYLFGTNRRKDGSTYEVEARLWMAPFRGSDAVWALLRDARGGQSLAEERDHLTALVESTSEAVVILTADGAVRWMNTAGLRMVGYEGLDALVGQPLLDLVPETEKQDLEQRILPHACNARWEGELFVTNARSEERIPCWLTAFPLRSRTGRLTAVALVARDISSRKVAELRRDRLLRLNEVSHRVATCLLEDDDLHRAIGIILEGAGGILDVARSYLCRYREDRRLLFRTHEWSSRRRTVRRVDPAPESSDAYSWATDILVQGDLVRISDIESFETPGSKSGTMFLPDVTAALVMPVIIHGRLESFFGFVHTGGPREWEDDEVAVLEIIVESFARAIERRIGDRERMQIAEDLEMAVARERAANRYKSEFLANMSHELRTPMNAIVGYAELLGRPNVDPEKQRAWVDNIRKSTDYLLSLINDVLDLSKIEAGQMTIETSSCPLGELIAGVEDLLRGWSQEKLLDFRVEYEGDVPAEIQTDPVRFKQILVNLIGNAIKFTHEGGVTVRVRAEKNPERDTTDLAVAVIDTGIGIAPEALADLFRPFTQVHQRRSSRFGGTGLGLDISRHLARLLGGEIEVESKIGLGSTFTFRMRLGEADAVPLAAPPVRGEGDGDGERPGWQSLGGRRILIVDDSLDNREVLRFLLSESGCACEAAENGALGVRAALAAENEGRPFDAILMDMSMPVLDGYEATARLKQAGVGAPVIALTAMAMAEDKDRCLEAGCVAYVTKPIVPHAFFQTIARHVAGEPGVRSPSRQTVGRSVRTDGGARAGGPIAMPRGAGQPSAAASLIANPRFAPLIRRYVASFQGWIEDLERALAEERLGDLRTQAHRLRGTASNYGFPEVSAAAGACEDAVRAEAPRAEVQARLAELVACLRRVREREEDRAAPA